MGSRALFSDRAMSLQHSTTARPYSYMPVKSCWVTAKSNGRSTWTRVVNWEAIITGRDGPCGSCGKNALNRQIYIVGYLISVERKQQYAAVCSTEQWLGIRTGGCSEWLRYSPEEWFRRAVRRLPRSWQRCTDPGRKYVELSVVWCSA